MTGKKKKALATRNEKQEQRLIKLLKHQAIYHQRGHDVTPVDDEIEELQSLGDYNHQPLEVLENGT